jgi:eukaryotic-like serine/threonine-protein kinase
MRPLTDILMIFKHFFTKKKLQEAKIPSIELNDVACAFKTGDIIKDRYEIERQLIDSDCNGWDETYLAIDRDSPCRQQVVINYLKLNISGRGRLTTAGVLFDREMSLLAKLSEQTDLIPRFYDCFQDRDEFYLVHEYIYGKSLNQIIDNIHLSEVETVSLIRDILFSLKIIHSHDTTCKYITSNNIVLRSRDGKLVFIYCGNFIEISTMKPLEEKEFVTLFNYSLNPYLPPEVAALRPQPASDIYAVGAIGIQCLVGQSLHKLTRCPSSEEIKWREHCQVSDRFADILNKMYEPSLKYRYSNIAEILEAIYKLYPQ